VGVGVGGEIGVEEHCLSVGDMPVRTRGKLLLQLLEYAKPYQKMA
jgi:hypothetical protein